METSVTAAPEMSVRPPAGVTLPEPRTVWFTARDGHWLNFKHLPRVRSTVDRGPVILVHGAGMRANLFCPPTDLTLPAMLASEGFDVWMLNWRSSIDLQPKEWDLDDAAVLDYPAAVEVIARETGWDTLKAVVHCQGSCSFLMSLVSGLLDPVEVTTVVANSSALHPVVPFWARIKLPLAMATFGRWATWFNPQYGLHAPRLVPKVMATLVRAFHHECNNGVCKHASFVYGVGFPTMWNHENLNDETHEWLKGEFGHVPVKSFKQMRKCVAKRRLVSMGNPEYENLPTEFASDAPKTGATFHFITGAENRCFTPGAVDETAAFVNRFSTTKRHTVHRFPGYGHMDVFVGEDASNDVFPYIVGKLCE